MLLRHDLQEEYDLLAHEEGRLLAQEKSFSS